MTAGNCSKIILLLRLRQTSTYNEPDAGGPANRSHGCRLAADTARMGPKTDLPIGQSPAKSRREIVLGGTRDV
jgi:hypothetical protein